ncbi:hypothetical protein KDA_12030 [Dictyobacter alpinus]|uniref:non-specific serine/threonine protein kinase n=1 Tax=Dictyobacter alpinus TaxID=2014873 RepID=A0A402B2Z7_9CHLR|nr:serine/threonine-protein kinase [Dictyobacter alpinus]GCE25719.1 hypothetical protein KDA_12030 [Dictyobacter alpinus]
MSTNPRYLGPYELQQRLSSTNQYEVWKAFDQQQQREVVITILHLQGTNSNELVPRFLYETKNLTALNHPSIAKIYETRFSSLPEQEEAGFTRNDAYIVCEYIEGVSLVDYIDATARVGNFPLPADIYHLLAPIGSAIDYAHQHGIIHSRLKPASIVFARQQDSEEPLGEAKLTGFGMHNILSPLGLPLGDVAYISPEVAQGLTENTRSDIYSLGVILYELCTGTLPFHADSASEMLLQHIHATPMSPALINPHIVPGLTAIILRCLAKDPASRYPTAAALVAAVARVLNSPSNSRLGISGTAISGNRLTPQLTPTNATDDVTYLSPLAPQISAQLSSTAQTGGNSNMPLTAAAALTPNIRSTQLSSDTTGSATISSQPTQQLPDAASIPVLPSQPAANQIRSARRNTSRKKMLAIWGSVLLCVIVIGAGLATLFLSQRQSVAAENISGHAFFVSSGLLDPSNPNGIVDGLQLDLGHIPPPHDGKSYYAWLIGDNDANVSIPALSLGTLQILNGRASKSYNSDNNENLLSHYSRFLVTEEDANTPPANPSLDQNTWRYGAFFSQVPSPEDTQNHYSLLDHMRHLLAQDPKLASVGLSGGLDIWLFRNTLKVLEWSGSARDAYRGGDTGLIQRQAVRILDYLDGTQYVQRENIPKTLSPILVDPKIARVALLPISKDESPPAYLQHIGNHLHEVSFAPNVNSDQKKLAAEINVAINNVKEWFMGVHDDAADLIHMTPEQLRQPSTRVKLNHMFKLANNAFVGEADPATNQVKEGVSQIHYKAQRLATFDIMACSASNANKPCI